MKFPLLNGRISYAKNDWLAAGGQMTPKLAETFFWTFLDICTQNEKEHLNSQKNKIFETPYYTANSREL